MKGICKGIEDVLALAFFAGLVIGLIAGIAMGVWW